MKLGIRQFWQNRQNWLGWLWVGSPVAMWLAYQPLIRFGQDETMHFELSVALIYVLVMALVSLPIVWKSRLQLVKSWAVWVVSLFVLVSVVSLFWAGNLTRGVLTVGVMGLLYLIFLGAVAMGDSFRSLVPKIVKVYIYSALVVCLLAIVQFFAGVWLDSSSTLLCAGCVAEQFGFVRPNVFVIEPQFLGNALLPAALLLTRQVIVGDYDYWIPRINRRMTISRGQRHPELDSGSSKNKSAITKLSSSDSFRGSSEKKLINHRLDYPNKSGNDNLGWVLGLWLALGLVVTVLVLTLSRGALLAFAVGVVVFLVIYRKYLLQWLKFLGVCLSSLIIALCLQGLTAAINPNLHETFAGAVSKSVNQLTMGVVDLPDSFESIEDQAVHEQPSVADNPSESDNKPNFDGYIEESTTARTSRSELALKRWSQDWQTVVFGVGVGSAGVAINQAFPDQLGAREIVQNEYIEVLLERGLVGLVSFVAILIGIFWLTRSKKWLWTIILAFMTQWLFFSGYPNVLHIYLVLIVIGVTSLKSRIYT